VKQNLGAIWNTGNIKKSNTSYKNNKTIDTMGYIQACDMYISAIPKVSHDRLTDTTQREQDGNKWNKDFTVMELKT
jgi:hypothetical protein